MSDITKRLRSSDVFNAPMTVNDTMVSPVALMAADEIERLRAALDLGLRMQEAQKAYFKGRTKDALVAAKALEAEFMHRARALLTEDGR